MPFIARYRKEVTGNLDEVQIRDIQEKLEYFRELEDRRETVLASIQEQGKLTPELKAKIEAALEKTELEDLYLPYKPKRRTKASIARDKGLEPLALFLWEQSDPTPLAEIAAQFGMPAEEALEGARHIVAEMISENADFRKAVRAMMMADGRVTSRAIEGVPDPEGKFKMYASYSEPASKIPSHRMLAIRRGAKEGVLTFEIELDPQQPQAWLRARVVRKPGDWVPHLEAAIEDSYDRLLNPSIQTEVRLELKDRSDEEAIKVFRENLENLLLSPPAGPHDGAGHRPGHSHRLQARRGGRYRQVPGRRRHLSVPAEERSRRLHQDAGLADRAPQRAGHRHRQRHGVARIGGLRAGLPAPGQPDEDLQRDGERIGRVASTRPRRWRGRSSPISTSRCAAPSRSRAACRIRWPNW